MGRARAFAAVLTLALTVGLAQGALAGPDPHGGGHGKGHGGGKPTPSPTASPTPTASPSPIPQAPESAAPSDAPESPSATADPAPDASSPEAPPPGQTGTVKIDGRPFDQHPDNEPHVGCVFEVDLFNYPEGGIEARYSVRLWPPTGRDQLLSGGVTLEDDPAGGGQDLDGEVRLDLAEPLRDSDAEPHPQQGWHVKISVRAPHSRGADDKHKVFWVRCAAPSPTVLPTTVTSPPAPPTVTPPGPLAFTGARIPGLAGLALLALLLGSASLRLSAHLRSTA